MRLWLRNDAGAVEIQKEPQEAQEAQSFVPFVLLVVSFLSTSRFYSNAFAIFRDLASRTKRTDRLAEVLSIRDEQVIEDDPIAAGQFLA